MPPANYFPNWQASSPAPHFAFSKTMRLLIKNLSALTVLILIFFYSGYESFSQAEDPPFSQNFISQSVIPENFMLPITVEKAVAYRDGGTIGVEVKDSYGQLLSFCLDRTLGWMSGYTKKRPDLYVGGLHSSYSTSRKVTQGGTIEQTILAMLEDWQKKLTSEEQKTSKAGLVAQVINILNPSAKNSGE